MLVIVCSAARPEYPVRLSGSRAPFEELSGAVRKSRPGPTRSAGRGLAVQVSASAGASCCRPEIDAKHRWEALDVAVFGQPRRAATLRGASNAKGTRTLATGLVASGKVPEASNGLVPFRGKRPGDAAWTERGERQEGNGRREVARLLERGKL
jgi:hypothetical protein